MNWTKQMSHLRIINIRWPQLSTYWTITWPHWIGSMSRRIWLQIASTIFKQTCQDNIDNINTFDFSSSFNLNSYVCLYKICIHSILAMPWGTEYKIQNGKIHHKKLKNFEKYWKIHEKLIGGVNFRLSSANWKIQKWFSEQKKRITKDVIKLG